MKFVSILALTLSVTALVVVLNPERILPDSESTPTKQLHQAQVVDEELKEELLKLKIRLASLEKRLENKTRQIEPIPQIQEEVAELSTFQNDLAEYTLNIDPLDVIGTQEREIEDAYNTLLDETKPAGERAKQAALLKKFNMFDEAAVASMTDLFLSATDTGEKAAALSALKGHVTPEVRAGVLETFSADIAEGYKNDRLRYFGIEALEPLLPDPEISAMLTILAQNDPKLKIANRAARSVGLPERQKEKNDKKKDG